MVEGSNPFVRFVMKRTKPTTLKIGDKVYLNDEEDSGLYEVVRINIEEDDCWLYGRDIGDDQRDMEQQLPLSWVENLYRDQNI
jgi:hypothetical protein